LFSDSRNLSERASERVAADRPGGLTMEEDFYLLLGLTTSGPEVPQAAIRKAYRVRALLCHPDKRGDDPVAGICRFFPSYHPESLHTVFLVFFSLELIDEDSVSCQSPFPFSPPVHIWRFRCCSLW
jgi:hypothetical protein